MSHRRFPRSSSWPQYGGGLAGVSQPGLRLGVDRLDQLWAAGITYIRLEWEFVYLAVILDAFSRRLLGWTLGRTLEATLTPEALRMVIEQR